MTTGSTELRVRTAANPGVTDEGILERILPQALLGEFEGAPIGERDFVYYYAWDDAEIHVVEFPEDCGLDAAIAAGRHYCNAKGLGNVLAASRTTHILDDGFEGIILVTWFQSEAGGRRQRSYLLRDGNAHLVGDEPNHILSLRDLPSPARGQALAATDDRGELVRTVVQDMLGSGKASPVYRKDIRSEEDARAATDLPLVYVWNEDRERGSFSLSVNARGVAAYLEKRLPSTSAGFDGVMDAVMAELSRASQGVILKTCNESGLMPSQIF